MAKNSDQKAGALDASRNDAFSGLLAEENALDRGALLRIGTWGFVAVGAVVVAVVANQSSLGWRREQVATADVVRQAQQIQSVAKESQNETRRLAAAIDTLNGDRDRLFSRVTVLEQGLDSVTGAIAQQKTAAVPAPKPAAMMAAASPATTTPLPALADSQPFQPSQPLQSNSLPSQAAAPAVAPVATTASVMPAQEKPKAEAAKPAPAATGSLQVASNKPVEPPAVASSAPALGVVKSMMGPPDPAAPKLVEPAKEAAKTTRTANTAPAPASAEATAAATHEAKESIKEPAKDQVKDQDKAGSEADTAKATVQRTDFAVDLGGANTIGGLRALWRGLVKSNKGELAELRPIMMLRENNTGPGMQLRLAAGPLNDAAQAAKICAALAESKRNCETTVFDGQRLAMTTAEEDPELAPGTTKPPASRRYMSRHSRKEDPTPAPAKPEPTTFSSLFGSRH